MILQLFEIEFEIDRQGISDHVQIIALKIDDLCAVRSNDIGVRDIPLEGDLPIETCTSGRNFVNGKGWQIFIDNRKSFSDPIACNAATDRPKPLGEQIDFVALVHSAALNSSIV